MKKNMLSKKLTLSLLIAMMTLAVFPLVAHSQATVGVEVGDWFVYNIYVTQNVLSGTSTGTNGVANVWRTAFPYTTYDTAFRLNRTVTAVSGTTITFSEKYVKKDGTTTTSTATANVSACNIYWRAIPSGLVADSALGIATTSPPYPTAGSYAINNTFARHYDGGDQTTCNMSWSYVHNSFTSAWPTYQWDQDTGILVYQNYTVSYTWSTTQVYTSFYLDLLYTNAWAANTIADYDLTIVANGPGTTTPTPGTYSYKDGNVVAVTATADALYELDHWLLDTVNVGAANPYNVPMSGDHTLTAVFLEIPSKKLNLTIEGGGTTNPAAGITLHRTNDEVVVTATDAPGWKFDHWVKDTVAAGSTNPYTITMDANHTLTAVFAVCAQYGLNITVDGVATTNPAVGVHVYNDGTDALVSVSSHPSNGYVFDHWLLDTAAAGSDNPITVTMDENHTLTAVCVVYPRDVAVSVGDWVTYAATYESTGDQSIQLSSNLNTTFTTNYNWTTENNTITAIDGLSITYTSDRLHANGTLMNITITEDITNNNNRFIVLADKEAGDWLISWTQYGSQILIVNDTTLMDFDFVGGAREVNHADWLDTQFGNGEAWWDAESGILLRYEYNYTITSGSNSRTFLFTMEITNTHNSFFEIPEYSNFAFTNITIILLMFVAAAISIDIFRRKKLKY